MEDLYRVVSSSPDQIISMVHFDPIKAHIAHHPRYPLLLAAYIECCKVGAPPEMASLLEEISHQSRSITGDGSCCSSVGTDPELDEFMESYCKLLHKYKEELSKPFIEATSFLSSIQSQLNNLSTAVHPSDEAAGISDMEPGCGGEVEELDSQECCSPCPSDLVLKEALMQKYSGYLCNLRNDFLSKRKKGKLPENAKTTLLDWWSTHYRWPYPTKYNNEGAMAQEEEKMKLSEVTGLDPRQINNWFINQRKRHWKPSESMRVALMEGVGGNIGGSHAPWHSRNNSE